MLPWYIYSILIIFLCIFSFREGIFPVFSQGLSWHIGIPFISGYLIYNKLYKLKTITFKNATKTGALLLIIASVLQFSAAQTSTLIISEISFIVALWGTILFFAGFSFFKTYFWPLIYLFFFLSVSDGIFNSLTSFFRIYTTKTACFLAALCGYSVDYNDTFIRLPSMVLNVARECSGVNHLISLFCISFPLAFFSQRSSFNKFIIIVSSLPLALAANSIRVFFLILYNFDRINFTHGPGNILITGFGFFIGITSLILLVIFLSLFNRNSVKTGAIPITNQYHFQPRTFFKGIHFILYFFILLSGVLIQQFWPNKQLKQPDLEKISNNLYLCSTEPIKSFDISSPFLPQNFQMFSIKKQDDLLGNLYIGHYLRHKQNNEAAGYNFNRLFSYLSFHSYNSTHRKNYRYA
ncbi:MAG: exosortase/archaeosortase family protein, partial [Fibrobacter sp.]|nr:exosortase/archaeosortase family protein [Fibrobacter sp.]